LPPSKLHFLGRLLKVLRNFPTFNPTKFRKLRPQRQGRSSFSCFYPPLIAGVLLLRIHPPRCYRAFLPISCLTNCFPLLNQVSLIRSPSPPPTAFGPWWMASFFFRPPNCSAFSFPPFLSSECFLFYRFSFPANVRNFFRVTELSYARKSLTPRRISASRGDFFK